MPCQLPRSAALALALLSLTFISRPLAGQETPTEREAAKAVIAKMSTLERSLDVPKLVAKLSAPNAARDKVTARTKQLMDTELLALADDITRHPEHGFVEHESVRKLTDYLKAKGFSVTIGVADLPTAFVAKRGSGTPNLGVIVEYDALRGTKGDFHGDQHSAQGPVGIAAAIAMAEYLEQSKTPGTVTVYGTPAEEMSPPDVKTQMFKAGIFNGADVIVRSHSSDESTRPAPGFGTCCLNIIHARYTFSGAPAHQMTAWNGRNALTAVIHMFDNVDGMRSNMRPEARVQGIIKEGGAAPNVVPDRTVAEFYIRYPDAVYLEQVVAIVDSTARAAALGTGTKVKIEHLGEDRDGISVATLSELGYAYMKKFGATKVIDEPGKPMGFEETGSVSMAIPGLGVSSHSSNGSYHTYEMEKDALAEVGHHGFVVDAQVMAAVLFDFATRPEYRAAVKREFDGIHALFGEYQEALKSAYPLPNVPEP
jgi:amidohydrolase